MNCVCCIGLSPNRSNIFYEVKDRTEIQEDLFSFVSELKLKRNETPRAIIYCRSFKMCSDLYAYFHLQLGQQSYFPDSGKPVSENRLFAMFHSLTPQRIKNIVLDGLAIPNGTVRIVFATMALGMGVNLKGVNRIIHYGSPSSLDNYFQECGRGGRTGEEATSVIYWKKVDCPMYSNPKELRQKEVCDVRKYLENNTTCRRQWLLSYFDASISNQCERCCDVCRERQRKD